MEGTVKRWNGATGIICAGEGCDFPFGRRDIQTFVAHGDEVEFWLSENTEGPLVAVDVRLKRSWSTEPISRSLFIGNIHFDADKSELLRGLETIGPVVSLKRRYEDPFGFVEFAQAEHARQAFMGEVCVIVCGRQLRFNRQRG